MRRLFPTFADGAPGAGLLLLRAAAAAAFILPALRMIMAAPHAIGVGGALGVADGLLLLLGLWTPVAAGVGVILALSVAAGSPMGLDADLLLAAVTTALALLGPGAWSIDARLFGWKRIEIASRKSDDAASR